MSQSYYGKDDASSTGAQLAAAREELKLSIAEVARHLKLSPAQVEALEAGAYERLPGRVFVRGFLRNYAKLVGLDPQPLLRRIESEMPQPRVVEEPPPATEAVMPTGERSRWPVYAGVAGTIVAALAAYEFGFNSPPPAESEKDAAASGPAAAPAEARTAAEPASAVPAGTAPDTSASAAVSPGVGGTTASSPSDTPSAVATGPSAPATETAAAAERGMRTLHFRFDEDSWVEVRDRNDKVIFTKLNRAGSDERVTGAPPLKLVVGNARGVRLSADDEPVDLAPHTGATVARLTLK